MKKKNILLVLMSCILLLGIVAGCTTQSEEPTQQEEDQTTNDTGDQAGANDEESGIVQASIMFYESPAVGKKARIDARVTQNKEPVEDAQEVLFEIGKASQDAAQDHDQKDMTQLPSDTAPEGEAKIEQDKTYIKAENLGKGIYRINATFTEEGDYYIIAHVTARDMHVMPKYEFNVTSP